LEFINAENHVPKAAKLPANRNGHDESHIPLPQLLPDL